MPQILERHGRLDLIRLLAIFGVICLHQNPDVSTNFNFGIALKLMCRWCVPFFFLLTGFFLPNQVGFPEVKTERIKRLVLLTLIANLMYLPLALAVEGIDALNNTAFVDGFWFHLWFLNAMIFGLLVITVLPSLLPSKTAITLFSLILLIAYFAVDIGVMASVLTEQQRVFARHLSAISFIWIGFQLGVNKSHLPRTKIAFAIVLIALLECVAEGYLLSRMGYPQLHRQFPLGAVFASIGLIFLGSRPSQHSYGLLEKLGREASLPLYIIHPIFLKIANLLIARTIATDNNLLSYFLVVFIGFFGSLGAYIFLEKYFPFVANLLNGRLTPLATRNTPS